MTTTNTRDRWQRRLTVWPLLMIGTPVVLLVSPLLLVVAIVIDMVSAPLRFRSVRLLGMAISYLVLEWCGMLAGFVLWVATMGGLMIKTAPSLRLHHHVQMVWARCIFGAIRFWFGAQVTVEGADDITAGPTIVAARHASFFDALLPAVILGQHRPQQMRHVLSLELSWDPCLELFGQRLPNHFVHRRSSHRAIDEAALRRLAQEAGDDDMVIFPEGTFRTPPRARAADAWLRAHEPDRAARLDLEHLLPPRATGILALMDGAPDSDLVIIGHTGFEAFGSIRQILANVPFRRPVHVKCWHISRSNVPHDEHGRMVLIDEWWQRLDDWIDEDSPTNARGAMS